MLNFYRLILLGLSLSLTPLALYADSQTTTLKVKKILEMTIDSSINPATYNYLKSGQKKAQNKKFDMLLIKINTPGGLVSVTKDILTSIGESDIPTIVWVTPEGASATSAGAIIASGAHILLMSEGTNIGAATPVQAGKDIDKESDLRKKSINDLVALVQSLAEVRGRNSKLFGKMIAEAASFSAQEALKEKLIDGIANDQDELFKNLDNRKISVKGKSIQLELNSPRVEAFSMDQGQKLLNILANPSLAYILFLIAAALIYLEFQAPGGFLAGSLGVLCLILAGIGFQVLPLNFGALGLLVLSFVLFILEIYITSYGILSLAGLAALLSGSLFLYRTEDSYLQLSSSVIYSAVGTIAAFLLFILFVILKDQNKIGSKEFNSMVGKQAHILEELKSESDRLFCYQVKVGGEMWKAESLSKLNVGEYSKVLAQNSDRMVLKL